MRDEPLEGDQESFNVTSAASAVDESYIRVPRGLRVRSPCILSGLIVPSSRRATPSLGRLQRNLTRSGHLHEPRSTTVRSALPGGSVTHLHPRQLPRDVLDHADCDQGDRDRPLDQRWWGLLVCSRPARALNDAFCHGWIIPCLSSLSDVHSKCLSPRALRSLITRTNRKAQHRCLGVEGSDCTR